MLMRHITQGGCGRPGAAREKTHSRPIGRSPRQMRADSARSRAPPGWAAPLPTRPPVTGCLGLPRTSQHKNLTARGPAHPRPKGRCATEHLTPPSLLFPNSANQAVAVSTSPPLPLLLGIGWIMTCAGALSFCCRLVGIYVNQ